MASVAELLNPLNTGAYLADKASKWLGPLVEKVSSVTLGSVYGDALLNYAVVMLFMISLFFITITDQAGLTAPGRTFILKFHFLFIKCVRCIATIGLFFLGKAIGGSNSFGEGLRQGAPIVVAGFALTFVQRFVESWTMTVPGQAYFDTPATAGAAATPAPSAATFKTGLTALQYNASNPVPWVHGTNWGVTIFMVLREYLNAVTQPCLDSLVGISRQAGQDLTADLVDGRTTAYLNTQAGIPDKLRFLWQFQNVSYNQGGTEFGGSLANDQSTLGQVTAGVQFANNAWYYSPLFVGIVVGLLK